MGEFDLTVCNNCGLPRGGFRGRPFPVAFQLRTPESKFANIVYECAKLVESYCPIPTTEFIITESGEHQFFCYSLSWSDIVDNIVQSLYQQS